MEVVAYDKDSSNKAQKHQFVFFVKPEATEVAQMPTHIHDSVPAEYTHHASACV